MKYNKSEQKQLNKFAELYQTNWTRFDRTVIGGRVTKACFFWETKVDDYIETATEVWYLDIKELEMAMVEDKKREEEHASNRLYYEIKADGTSNITVSSG